MKYYPPPAFPSTKTREYLLVDMVNRISELGEDHEAVLSKVALALATYDLKKLSNTVKRYGKIKTKKFFNETLCLSTN